MHPLELKIHLLVAMPSTNSNERTMHQLLEYTVHDQYQKNQNIHTMKKAVIQYSMTNTAFIMLKVNTPGSVSGKWQEVCSPS